MIALEVLAPDGAKLAVTLDAPAGSGVAWLVAPDPALVRTPAWLERAGEAYWLRRLEPEHALYLAYNRCAEDTPRARSRRS